MKRGDKNVTRRCFLKAIFKQHLKMQTQAIQKCGFLFNSFNLTIDYKMVR